MSVIVICPSNIRGNITRDMSVICDTKPRKTLNITRDNSVICDMKGSNAMNITQIYQFFCLKFTTTKKFCALRAQFLCVVLTTTKRCQMQCYTCNAFARNQCVYFSRAALLCAALLAIFFRSTFRAGAYDQQHSRSVLCAVHILHRLLLSSFFATPSVQFLSSSACGTL